MKLNIAQISPKQQNIIMSIVLPSNERGAEQSSAVVVCKNLTKFIKFFELYK
jgi:hypothetical protein